MRMYDIIERKRDGYALTDEEIRYFVTAYTSGDIPDYQASALAMAIYFRGMNDREIAELTLAMANSGDTVDLSGLGGVTCDKHSTGGVGDKTTLIVAPIVASCGGIVAKMSGRGLGHTGGTVDKLESIPGFRTELSSEEFLACVKKAGICVVGQSGNLAPADKKLYALRDVTATVPAVPLIASSIMSKKIAAGSECIVLDVKVGSGAFMKTPDDARLLAEKMVAIGTHAHRRVAAVLTDMDVPLGYAIGNALEVIEAVDVLRGRGPEDLREVALTLAATLLFLMHGAPIDACRADAEEAIRSGRAFEKLCTMVEVQGGDVSYLTDTDRFPKASAVRPVYADRDGYIAGMETDRIGISSVILGAGREVKGAPIDHSAGIVLNKKTGDAVARGDLIATLYTSRPEKLDEAENVYRAAIRYTGESPVRPPLIYDVIR